MATTYRKRIEPRSVGELLGEVTQGVAELLRQELDLARTEVGQKAASAAKDVALIAGGGLVAYSGFLSVVAALVLLIGHRIPLWVSALLVGLAVIGAGYLLIRSGLSAIRRTGLAPTYSIDSLQETARWAKEQVG